MRTLFKSFFTLFVSLSFILHFPLLGQERMNKTVITGFTLIDAETDIAVQPMDHIMDIETLTSSVHPKINIEANTASGFNGSIVFELNGEVVSVGNDAPYAVFGRNDKNYISWIPRLGNYTIKATAYEGKNGKGKVSNRISFAFTFIKTYKVQFFELINEKPEEVFGLVK